MSPEVGIVGAGLAGLACARRLGELDISYAVYEASDRVGGRVATDRIDGYTLDRGFQVLLDSYPEAERQLDMPALGLRKFEAGALVWKSGRFWRITDPWRSLWKGIATLRAPFVGLSDALRMASLRKLALSAKTAPPEQSCAEFLKQHGFSDSIMASFFRPFFGGVTLDAGLSVPANYFLSLFGFFSTGSATLPKAGMQAIPEQMAAGLKPDNIHLGTPVSEVTPNSIALASGERINCKATVLATDGSVAAKLQNKKISTEWLGTTTLYYACDKSPVGEPILVLNGEGSRDGPVNHLCVLSDAQPSYAPNDKALLSVSVVGIPSQEDEALDKLVRDQLKAWYGNAVADWQRLRIDRIERALPRFGDPHKAAEPENGLYVCGDHVSTPSIQGSLESGLLTAESISLKLK